MREKLIRLTIRYGGDYFQIREALKRQEDPKEIPLQQAITITDEDYPGELLELKYPPFVLSGTTVPRLGRPGRNMSYSAVSGPFLTL